MNMPRRMRRGEGYRDATEPKTIGWIAVRLRLRQDFRYRHDRVG